MLESGWKGRLMIVNSTEASSCNKVILTLSFTCTFLIRFLRQWSNLNVLH